MAFKYKLSSNTPDSHQSDPYWLVTVIRFRYRDTYNRHPTEPGSLGVLKLNPGKVLEELEPLIIDSDCVAWQVTSSKSSHVMSCSMNLIYTGIDYGSEIAPDDWVILWAFDNYSDYKRVKELVLSKKRANHFKDGIKFMGRVQSLFENISVDPNSGTVVDHFELNAAGFAEFDSIMFYHPAIARKYPQALQWMEDFGGNINDFLTQGAVDTNKAIRTLLNICLGRGPGERSKGVSVADLAASGVKISKNEQKATTDMQASPNQSYGVPTTVGGLILDPDETPTKSIGLTYPDLLKHWSGIQLYSGNTTVSGVRDDFFQLSGFVPAYSSVKDYRFYESPYKLTGDFRPQPVNFNQTTVWSLLKKFLNEPINEMYTCLRVDETGHVMPSLIVRQIPFSSPIFIEEEQRGTGFLTLPQWEIDVSMVQSAKVGRSNATRFNYVHLIPNNPLNGGTPAHAVASYVLNKPVVDDADIKRSGLRPYMAQVDADVISAQKRNDDTTARFWTKLMADMLFGSQLKFSGTIVMKGIQEPIVIGDNCLFDGVIYHIEQVSHSGSIDRATGHRDFSTTVQVSNGVSDLSNTEQGFIYPDGSKSRAAFRSSIAIDADSNGNRYQSVVTASADKKVRQSGIRPKTNKDTE